MRDSELTLTKAISIARIHEMTEESSKTLATATTSVDAVKPAPSSLMKPKQQSAPHTITNCSNCGGSHTTRRENCPAFGKQCHGCKKLNHYRQYCKSKPRSQLGRAPRRYVNEIEVAESTVDDDETYYVEIDRQVDCVNSETDERKMRDLLPWTLTTSALK